MQNNYDLVGYRASFLLANCNEQMLHLSSRVQPIKQRRPNLEWMHSGSRSADKSGTIEFQVSSNAYDDQDRFFCSSFHV
jgi:hypothetical protein